MPPEIDPAQMISRLAEERLGPPPQQMPPQMQQQQAPPPTEKPTAEEKAIVDGSPSDEGSRMEEDAILYEIGGRKLTPQQISSTFDRYRNLNYQHQEASPVLRVMEAIMKSGSAKSPQDVAKMMLAAAKAGESNPQMGADAAPPKTGDDDDADPLAKWEEENAAQLPPGYRDMSSNMRAVMQGQQQLMEMLGSIVQQSRGVAEASQGELQSAQEARAQAHQQKIANNLEALAGKIGLQDSDAGDFMIFAGERGYTLDDFIDPRLAARVMTDFKANRDTPEMDRLRQIASRRQAFTGSMAQTPSAAPSEAASQEGGDPRLARLAQGVLNNR